VKDLEQLEAALSKLGAGLAPTAMPAEEGDVDEQAAPPSAEPPADVVLH